jgi:uncharacterized membrane protein
MTNDAASRAECGSADIHDDDGFVRRSVTVRRPRADVERQWDSTIAGVPTFLDAPPGRGTEVHVRAPHETQNGLKEIVNSYSGDDPGESLAADLRKFKARLETGEIPTVLGQPSGREAID